MKPARQHGHKDLEKEKRQGGGDLAEAVVETVREPLLILSGELRIKAANRSFYQTFRVLPEETENRLIYEVGNHQWDIPKLRELLEDILPEHGQVDEFEVQHDFQSIGHKTMLINARRLRQREPATELVLLAIEDITERKRAEEELTKHREHLEELVDERTEELRKANAQLVEEVAERKLAELRHAGRANLLDAVNRVFKEARTHETEEEVGQTCLAVAEELTGSKFGFVSEVNQAGRLDTIALSNPGWQACKLPKTNAARMLRGMEIRGIWSRVLREGESQIVNDPASDPDRVGTPEGHPALTAFLGVPLKHRNKTFGLIALANKRSGYDSADKDAIETLSVAFVEALMRTRAETGRKRAEDELKQSAEELARSNAELEQFAYIASHDLQEPLRMVASYTQLLGKRYKGKLDDDADEFISFAVDGANRMQRLINDLLMYSRAATRGQGPEPTYSEQVLDEALAGLQMAITESAAQVTHDPLPKVLADGAQLGQVFQNLIGNALKYRGDAPPRIHVSAAQEGDMWVFSVRDNGIGIDPEYHERVFVIFQRLCTREEESGTGIGLAVCKKIVERHGGRIWLESELGKGATFYFTVPAMPAAQLAA